MKAIISIACLLLVAASISEARPKRSVLYAAAPLAVASVPVVRTASVVHSHPTTVVKTEQVHDGVQSSYSYSSETKSNPVVHTHTAVAAPVAAVSTLHHTVPTAYAYGYLPYHSYASHYYSPYHYVVGK